MSDPSPVRPYAKRDQEASCFLVSSFRPRMGLAEYPQPVPQQELHPTNE